MAARENNAINEVITAQQDFSGHVIIADQSTVLFNKVYGESTTENQMSYHEKWRWASVTKQLVAVAILQMVEEGVFSLETPLAEVLSDSEFPNAQQITISNLLQHTSGMINDEDLPDESFITGFDSRAYCSGPAKRLPGESFEYNNCDYIVLGQILEAVDKEPWFESLNKRIFVPADMKTMSAGANNGGETVQGFSSSGVPSPGVALKLYEAAGGLVGTAEDLVRFDRALLSGKLLSDKTREILWNSDPTLGYAAYGQWVFPVQLRGCDNALDIVERRGAISGVKVLNVIVPENTMSIIVFVNREDFDWGTVWTQSGFVYDLLSAAICRA